MNKPLNKETFMLRVAVSSPAGCWLWKGPFKKDTHQYGWVGYKRTQIHAHRLAWIFFRGDIPKGMLVCHSCDVPQCVNPEHLFLGTNADNMHDMRDKGRRKGIAARKADGRMCPARLTFDNVSDIRRALVKGTSQQALVTQFGVAQSTISRIARGAAWNYSNQTITKEL